MSDQVETLPVTEFYVVRSYDLTDIKMHVNALLKNGWKLQGGIAASGGIFYQAMIKEST